MQTIAPHIRFREARERAGLSAEGYAASVGLHRLDVWEIEGLDGHLTCCHSPKQVQKYCQILRIRPVDLFADCISESAISAADLVQLIHTECRSRGITLDQFEDIVEWRLTACIEPPEKLLEDMTIDGLQWLCREIHIDWRRVLLSL